MEDWKWWFTSLWAWERHYETKPFYSKKDDTRYHDADVTKQIYFDSQWAISEIDDDDKANIMHDNVVKELSEKLLEWYTFSTEE